MSDASLFPLDPPFKPLASHAERRDRGGLRRIRDMRFAEMAYRGWQEATQWLERVNTVDIQESPETLLRRHAPALADPEEALYIVRRIAPARFFAGVADAGTSAAVNLHVAGHQEVVVASADALLEPDVDPPGHGDTRFAWELNRHQWLVRLAQARALGGNERYAEACVRTIERWLEANPPGAGVNWTSSAEVALRMMSWCWVLMLLRESPSVSAPWVQRLLTALWLHATHVRRNLSCYCTRNTDLTTEALGLFYAATLFPEFREAQRWREVAVKTLVIESDAQVCRDGVHFEQSTCYHRYSVDALLHFTILAERNNVDVPHPVRERVQQMVEFLVAVGRNDGRIPAIGDDDGGSLLRLTDRATADARGLFAVAAVHFLRRDFAWAAGGPAPEMFWLVGSDAAATFARIGAAPPACTASRVFPSGGYAVMRGGWNRDAHHAIVDIGPLGCPVSGGHGHADLLSMQCSIFGEPCLVDAGTYSYGGEPHWREFFRSTAAHSTLMIDGLSQAEPLGSFGWKGQPRVRLREWHSTEEFDFLDAEHDGYASLPDPVVHRRRVIFVKPGYWLLIDDLSGSAHHKADLAFQFDRAEVTLGHHPWARARTPGGPVLWISPFPSAPVHPSLKSGELTPPRGWISTEYGQRRAAPMLIYSFAVALPWRIVTLLLPDRQGQTMPPAVRGLYDAAGLPTGVAFDRPRRTVRFDDRAISVERE